MPRVNFERLPEGFAASVRTIQFGPFIMAAFACAGAWFLGSWIHQEWNTSGGIHTNLVFFGLPLGLGLVAIAWHALQGIAGKVAVRKEGEEAVAFEGIGPLGSTQRFQCRNVTGVEVGPLFDKSARRGSEVVRVSMRGDKNAIVKFGRMLTPARRKRLAAILREEVGRP